VAFPCGISAARQRRTRLGILSVRGARLRRRAGPAAVQENNISSEGPWSFDRGAAIEQRAMAKWVWALISPGISSPSRWAESTSAIGGHCESGNFRLRQFEPFLMRTGIAATRHGPAAHGRTNPLRTGTIGRSPSGSRSAAAGLGCSSTKSPRSRGDSAKGVGRALQSRKPVAGWFEQGCWPRGRQVRGVACVEALAGFGLRASARRR